MDFIVEEKEYTFKELEQEIFRLVCRAGAEVTQAILKRKDEEIFRDLDRERYKSEGFRKTSIKTIYGVVTYSRRVYRTQLDDGKTAFVYLLDQYLGLEKIGLVSENLAEKIAELATEATFRETAETISNTTGLSISAQGAWGIVQCLGERIKDEEACDVARMRSGTSKGKKTLPVLFEEMDGVWVRQQGEHHEKKPMQEIKVAVTYEGWDAEKEKQQRSTLVEKHVVAGIEDSKSFHEKREADIRKRYNADEIMHRIVNGDGGSWIGEPNDPDAIVQLDRFHVHKEIRKQIADKEVIQGIEEYLSEKDIKGMLSYIKMYADSVAGNDEEDKRSENALKLLKYLSNNKEGLIPWQDRGLRLPAAPEGVIYKGMGVQENQNCTVITLRMKHRRMRWSRNGGNNMAKVLARKENQELRETIKRYAEPLTFKGEITEAVKILSAAKSPKKDGKGNSYADKWNVHMPILDAVLTEARRYFRVVSI